MNVNILYEDNHIIAVDKPAGLLTQPDYSDDPSLLEMVKQHIKKRDKKPGNVFLGMVQRLDRPVSGVIFFAKTSKAASRLSGQIRQRKTEKLYLAIAENRGSYFVTDRWKGHQAGLVRVKDKTRVSSSSGQKSALQAMIVAQDEAFCCLLVKLITGRKHQIRAQLSHLGYPIIGDVKYGSRVKLEKPKMIALHAWRGVVSHPTKKDPVRCVARLPPVFERYLGKEMSARVKLKLSSLPSLVGGDVL